MNRLLDKRTIITGTACTVVTSRLALPHMISAGGGSIINTASIAGLVGDALQCAYGTSKAAVIRRGAVLRIWSPRLSSPSRPGSFVAERAFVRVRMNRLYS